MYIMNKSHVTNKRSTIYFRSNRSIIFVNMCKSLHVSLFANSALTLFLYVSLFVTPLTAF